MAVAFDAVGPSASGANSATSPLTWTHTTGGAANLALIVFIDVSASVTSSATCTVTYNGVSMTSLGSVASNSGTNGILFAFYLAGNNIVASAGKTITATVGGTTGLAVIVGGSMSFSGVNQASPVGSLFTGTGSSATPSVTVTSSTSGNLIAAAGAGGNSWAGTGITSPATQEYEANVNTSNATGSDVGGYQSSTGSSVTINYAFASGAHSYATAAVELKASSPAALQDFPNINPGRAWLHHFKPGRPQPPLVPESQQSINCTGSFALAPITFSSAAGTTSVTVPVIAPGTTWFDHFKPGVPKPRPPPPSQQSINAKGSFALGPIHFGYTPNLPAVPGRTVPGYDTPGTPAFTPKSGQGAQTSPDQTEIQPGSAWLKYFKRLTPKPVPLVPSVQSVNGTGSFALAPIHFAASGGQTSSDIPQIQPGSVWLKFFKPWANRPDPLVPTGAPLAGVSSTGSFALAPLAFSAQGGQTSPDVPHVLPGPFWSKFFKPWVQDPTPLVPAQQNINSTGSFTLAPLAFSAQAGQSSTDINRVLPGPFWVKLLRPWINDPLPPISAQQNINATGSFSLAPIAFAANAAQTSPDQTQTAPGQTWLQFFKQWINRPAPPLPSQQNINSTGSFNLAPITFASQGAQTSPDIPSALPGPMWLRLLKPWINRPVPPLPSVQPSVVIGSTGSFALAPLAFAAQGGVTSSDVPQTWPGPTWLQFFKQWVNRPAPPIPAQQNVNGTASFTLAPLAFNAQGSQTGTDIPQIQPGSTWLRLLKPWTAKPLPPIQAQQSISSSGSFSLAPLAFAAQGGQTSSDIPSVQPGQAWLKFFKAWVNRPDPLVPSQQNINGTASFSLAPLAFNAQGAQTSSDTPEIIPGPFWLRFFKPWVLKPAPQVPVVSAVNATGSFSLAPIAFNASGAVFTPSSLNDLPVALPGPAWLKFFKPWVQRPAPFQPAQQSINGTGNFSLAPLHFSAQGAETSPDVPQILPGPMWLRLLKPWTAKPTPPIPAVSSINATGSFALAPITFAATGNVFTPGALQDIPIVQPGPMWLRVFKPWIQKPPPFQPAQQSVNGTASFTLAPLAFSAQGGETSSDIPTVQPGPTWVKRFRQWKPIPPLPAQQNIGCTGSFALAPLAFAANGAQTSTDQTEIQPGNVWVRLLKPWIQRFVPPIPAQQNNNSTGSFTLAPITFTAQGGQTSPDVPAVNPGSFWLKFFKPWIKSVPTPPDKGSPGGIATSGGIALAPLAFAGQGAETAQDINRVLPGPVWFKHFQPWRKMPWTNSAPPGTVPCSGGITLAPIAFQGSSVANDIRFKWGLIGTRWLSGAITRRWKNG